MSTKAAFHQALSDLTGQIAGRPLNAALADWLNDVHGAESVSYQTLKAACVQGVEEAGCVTARVQASAMAASSRQKTRCTGFP